jgi:hypothetical protein
MTEIEPATRRRGLGASRLVLGLYLVLMGALVLAVNLGYEIPGRLWSYWPFLLVGLGAVKLAWAGERDERRSGYWLLIVGLYGLICVFGLFGLGWGEAWPIFLLAYGALLVHDSWRGGGARGEGVRER